MRRNRQNILWIDRLNQLVLPGLMLLGSALVVAQYQVNRQVNVGGGPPSVRYASSPYAQRYNPSATAMMPSQQRNAVVRSGAMPSEVRGSVMATGPMSPSGSLAYLPANPTPGTRSPNQAITSGTMVNPQFARPTGAMPGMATPNTGSVKYAPGPMYQSSLTPASSLGLAQSSGVPVGQAPYGQTMTGSVRYGQ